MSELGFTGPLSQRSTILNVRVSRVRFRVRVRFAVRVSRSMVSRVGVMDRFRVPKPIHN